MTSRARSRKEELAQLRERLRAERWTHDQIADRIRAEHGVNSRVAFRLAHGLTQQQVADRWNELWPHEDGPKTGKHISYWEAWPAPSGRTPTLATLGRLAVIYQCRPGDLLDHDDYPHLGLDTGAVKPRNVDQVEIDSLASAVTPGGPPMPHVAARDVDLVSIADSAHTTVDRRTILGGASASIFATVLGVGSPADPRGLLVAAVLGGQGSAESTETDLVALTQRVAAAKRRYQSCAYAGLLTSLPPLLGSLNGAADRSHRRDIPSAYRLTAEAFQIAGSVLLKLGDVSMAMLAADRSLTAANHSGDPITVAASARLVTHALISAGHPIHGAEYAADTVDRLDQAVPATPTADAVLGALLLRGAIAAARASDRHGATDLLSRADERAARGVPEGNLCWTGFNTANVQLHRVHAALTLGDAGQAIDHAHRIDLTKIDLPERRARLMIDVAHAYHQWNKPESAYQALRAAEETAPEEVHTRTGTRQLIDNLQRTAPASLRPHLAAMAQRGASA